MIKIAAVDDDKEWLRTERRITEQFFQGKENYKLYEYSNIEKFLLELEDEYFDIFLLDMELPETNGLKIAGKIKQIQVDSLIIYITNYVEYAVEAFEVNAYRYIPKNILEEKLPEAYGTLLTELNERKVKYFVIQNNSHMEKIPEDQIYYLHKDKKYVIVVHKFGESKIRTTLDEVQQELNQADFVRIDKSYIVNLKHVMGLGKSQIKLRNNTYLPVSQPQLTNVKKRISEYWRS